MRIGDPIKDLRYGLRLLARSPGFTAVAVITLALGIGANAAIFSVINAVLLQPLPFPEPDRLALVFGSEPRQDWPQLPLSQPNFNDIRQQSRSFDSMASWTFTRFNLTGSDEPEEIQSAIVNASFFPTLGVKPALGRDFLPEEDRPGSAPVVMLSDSLWRRRFGGNASVLGSAVNLDGRSYEVIGVLPEGFQFANFPKQTELWIPFGLDPFDGRKYARGNSSLLAIGRLARGVTLDQAQAELSTISARLTSDHPETSRNWSARLNPLREQAVQSSRAALLVLLGAVGFVMLIACANVANLLLARGSTRRREMAVRAALGAGRGRIVAQLLTENVGLSMMGGLVGLLVAVWGIDLLSILPFTAPSLFTPYTVASGQVAMDGPVLAFTFALSVLTGLVFGLAPALSACRPSLVQSLKEGGARDGGARQGLTRNLLVIGEVALSMTLLIGSGLMLRSFARLQAVDPGFKPDNVLTMEINLPRSRYPEDRQASTFFTELLSRVSALPSVTSTGVSQHLPMSGTDASAGFYIEGWPAPAPTDRVEAHYRSVSPGYLQTLGIAMLRGRSFTPADSEGSRKVTVINETMARRFWPGEDPIGRRIALNFEAMRFYRDRAPELDLEKGMREIVGVAADVRHARLDGESFPEMYIPHAQMPSREMSLVVRTTTDPLGLAAAVRRQVLEMDKDQPVSRVSTMDGLLALSVAQPRSNALLLSLFGALALVLAAVGVYGVISFAVAQRTREIGIRMALGAQGGEVLKMIVLQGAKLTFTGMAIGLVAALWLTRMVSGLLFAVSPTDPAIFAGTALLLAAVSLLACYLPARRATKVDPMVALRCE